MFSTKIDNCYDSESAVGCHLALNRVFEREGEIYGCGLKTDSKSEACFLLSSKNIIENRKSNEPKFFYTVSDASIFQIKRNDLVKTQVLQSKYQNGELYPSNLWSAYGLK